MMVRMQIMLESEAQRRARDKAAQLGISFAEYIRRLVARDVDEPDSCDDPSVVFNLGDSGGTDIARNKDALIGAAVQADQNREFSR